MRLRRREEREARAWSDDEADRWDRPGKLHILQAQVDKGGGVKSKCCSTKNEPAFTELETQL